MTDWKSYKGAGPWPFDKCPNKWRYSEGDRIETVDNPIFVSGPSDGSPLLPDHDPCGYWPQLPTRTNYEIETYIELLSSGCCMPDMCANFSAELGPYYDVTFISTYRPLNTEDYAGDNVTYTFEITASNISWINDGYVYLVDEDDNIVATIIVPQGYRGPYTFNSDGSGGSGRGRARQYWVFTTEFTPLPGSHQYGLRVYIANTGYQDDWNEAPTCIVKVPSAKIRIRQQNPSTSVVHIPMMTLVNDCHMDWTGPVMAGFGQHAVSVGHETGGMDLDELTYKESGTSRYYGNGMQIWKFDTAQLNKASKIVFDAALVYNPSDYITTSSLILFGIPTLSWAAIDLRWSTANSTSTRGFTDGGPGTADAHIGADTYYYIEGSKIEWGLAKDGQPWQVTVELDVSSLTAAIGKNLYICSLENVYGGTTPSGPYTQWPRFRAFSVPEGRTISRAWITYYAYRNTTLGRNEIRCTFDYELTPPDIRNGYVILYDNTADEYIEESELVWDTFEYWSRKSVEFDASLLTSGHEYSIRWKSEDLPGATTPYITDANLWIKVIELTKFTSWLRVIKGSMTNWRFPGVYADYFSDDDMLYLDVSHRTKPFIKDGSKVYFEICYYDYCNYPLPISLWDTGEAVSGIGTTTSKAVMETLLNVGNGYDGVVRLTTGELTSITNNYYITNMYADEAGCIYALSGFIVVEY